MSQPAEEHTCCCMEDIRAVTQAAVDQLVGMNEMITVQGIALPLPWVLRQTTMVAEFLQPYLDKLQEDHGPLDSRHIVSAVSALLTACSD